jgi:hypothetical protein
MGDRGTKPAKYLGRDLDAGKAAPHDKHVILTGADRAERQPSNMIGKSCGAFKGVDIKGMLRKSRDIWPSQAATKSEAEPIIGQGLCRAVNGASDFATGDINIGDLRYDVFNADRVQDVGQWNPRRLEIGFVVANPDRMPRGAIDDKNLDPIAADAKLVQPPRRGHRAPKPGEPGAKHENPQHPTSPIFCNPPVG